MSATIIQFVPRGRLGRVGDYHADYYGPQEPNGMVVDREKPSLEQQAVEIMNVALLGSPHETAMAEYYRDCAKTGSPPSPDKAREGMPGVVRTADGDLINVGSEFYESSLGFVAPEDCA